MNRDDYLAEIKKEIDEIVDIDPLIKESDITLKDIMGMYDVSEKKAKRIMVELSEDSNEWNLIKVRDGRPNRPIWALRRSSSINPLSA